MIIQFPCGKIINHILLILWVGSFNELANADEKNVIMSSGDGEEEEVEEEEAEFTCSLSTETNSHCE